MSDTPRTDEVWASMHGSGYQMMLLCQKLEREVAELQNAFEDAVTAREQVEQERDKHFFASKAQNEDITVLQAELAAYKLWAEVEITNLREDLSDHLRMAKRRGK